MSKRLIRKKVTAARVGYHPVHIMRLAAQGKFPQPVKLGDPEDPRSAVAFVESEVEAWIRADTEIGLITPSQSLNLRHRSHH